MANCYLCGCKVSEDSRLLRRKVKTGEYVRKRFSPYRLTAVQATFGMRIVCKRCAKLIDRQALKTDLLKELWVFVAIVVLILIFLIPRLFG